MSDNLVIDGQDVASIIRALSEGKTFAADIRIISARGRHLSNHTLCGNGWTLYAALLEPQRQHATALRLTGDRARFEEDFLTAKMSI